jgi:hypothetical protein
MTTNDIARQAIIESNFFIFNILSRGKNRENGGMKLMPG